MIIISPLVFSSSVPFRFTSLFFPILFNNIFFSNVSTHMPVRSLHEEREKNENEKKIADKNQEPERIDEKRREKSVTGKLKNKFFSKQQLSIKDYKHIYIELPVGFGR